MGGGHFTVASVLPQRYLELESSGHRNEIRLHYRSGTHRSHTEVFPYILADDKWHRLSLAISASHLILHVDCNNGIKVIIFHYIFVPPFCIKNRIYERVVEKPYMDLPVGTAFWLGQRNSAHGYFKLSRAEQRMTRLDQCYCERTCSTKGATYREFESWTDGCKNCTCVNGTIQCEALICPLSDCPQNSAPGYVDGKCCKECQRKCLFL
ncbi:hypothetical protein JD844_027877 [Phrynosoma platyrhinos]|uniref:VWFC domain-containing protein n=1 Tax=Phrynosoma platyrhinos TaxID=52577 RepID=A0ABQ7SGW9_PHRPL|nr:hypothetical protein JD844_027877 [Phrynosoma platyrhinos]